MDNKLLHDDVIKWKHFPRYWPFVRGIHRSAVNSPHKGQWRGALKFLWSVPWINGWVNNHKAGDLSGEFPSQRPVTRSFEVSLIGALNKRLSKQSWSWWFEPPSCSLWRHCNALNFYDPVYIYIHTCVVKYTSLVIFKARNTRMDRSKIIYTKSAATSHEGSLNDGR